MNILNRIRRELIYTFQATLCFIALILAVLVFGPHAVYRKLKEIV